MPNEQEARELERGMQSRVSLWNETGACGGYTTDGDENAGKTSIYRRTN